MRSRATVLLQLGAFLLTIALTAGGVTALWGPGVWLAGPVVAALIVVGAMLWVFRELDPDVDDSGLTRRERDARLRNWQSTTATRLSREEIAEMKEWLRREREGEQ